MMTDSTSVLYFNL